jgi:fatty acid desaturase
MNQLRIVCLALVLSVVMVNVTLLVLSGTGEFPPPTLQPPVPYILFAVALVLLVSSPAVKGAVFKRADAEGFGGDTGKRFAAYQTATIVANALREAAGIIGFLLALLTGNLWWSWGLGAAAVIAILMDWPKEEHVGL